MTPINLYAVGGALAIPPLDWVGPDQNDHSTTGVMSAAPTEPDRTGTLRCYWSHVVEDRGRLVQLALIVGTRWATFSSPTFEQDIWRPTAATWRRARNGAHVVEGASQEVDAIISNAHDWRGELLSQLRGIVLAADPAIDEDVKWKKPSKPEGVPVWSCNGIVCIGEMLKNAVRLTFPKGAHVKDPQKLFNTRLDSKSVRAIDFREGGQLPEAALTALVRAAVALNG